MKHSIAIASKAPYEACPFLFVGNIYTSISRAKVHCYDAVELHLPHPEEIDSGQLMEYCLQHDMWVSTFATGTSALLNKVDFIHPDRSVRDRAIELVSGFIEKAEPFKAGIIIGDMRGNIPNNEDPSPYYERLEESIRRLVDKAEMHGVSILMETINRYEKNYMNRVDDLLAFINEISSPSLKIHLDFFHMNIEEPDMLDAIFKSKNFLSHVHLADNTRRYPGTGSLNFKSLITAVESVGFTGYYTLECLPLPDGDTAAMQSLQYIKSLFPEKGED